MPDPLALRVPTVPAVRSRRAPLRADGTRTVTAEVEVVEPEARGRVILEERITIVRRWLVTEAA